MPRVDGKDIATLTYNAQTFLAETKSLDFKVSAQEHDTTTLGDDWLESTAGLKGGDEISWTLFYTNDAATGTYAYFTSRLGGAVADLVIGDGTRTTTAPAWVKEIGTPIDVADMIMLEVTLKISGTVAFT